MNINFPKIIKFLQSIKNYSYQMNKKMNKDVKYYK